MQTNPKYAYEIPESLAKNLGIQILSIDKGTAKASMPVNACTSRPCEPKDILNGGASLALAETVAGYGSLHLCDETETPVGIQISANHVAMVEVGHTVYATGTLIHHGRTQHVWNIDIVSDENKLISTARVTNLIIKKHK